MKERPILFSTEMVRAILDGRKTQTRRVFPFQTKVALHKNGYQVEYFNERDGQYYTKHFEDICKYGKIGDRLWVRETFHEYDNLQIPDEYAMRFIYKADYEDDLKVKWKPSIYMPREVSRITLEITNLRVERLNNISGQDCWDEGITMDCEKYGSVIECYRDLWESINGEGSWDLNPFVWVIEFKKVRKLS